MSKKLEQSEPTSENMLLMYIADKKDREMLAKIYVIHRIFGKNVDWEKVHLAIRKKYGRWATNWIRERVVQLLEEIGGMSDDQTR